LISPPTLAVHWPWPSRTPRRVCVVSFTSDWLYPTSDSRAIVHALNAGGASVSFVEIESDKGHDAFLLHEPMFIATTRGFLDSAAAARGLAPHGNSK
jgi:homoserine O-acetyltransferase